MKMRVWHRIAALMMLAAGMACAQLPTDLVPEASAPADVTKALRDRVTQFFNFHMGTVNRRAIDLVAEETKDYYFSAQKMILKDFKIDSVDLSKDYTQAIVKLHATRPWDVQGQAVTVDTAMVTNWKVEEGKWVWYVDWKMQAPTPMGMSDFLGVKAPTKDPAGELLFELNPDGTPKIPEDFSSIEKLQAQTQKILNQSGVDKTETILTYGVASTDQFVFRNGLNGDVLLELGGSPEQVKGLKVSLEKANLGAQQSGIIKVTYNPPPEAAKEFWQEQTFTVNLFLQPFAKVFPLTIRVRPSFAK